MKKCMLKAFAMFLALAMMLPLFTSCEKVAKTADVALIEALEVARESTEQSKASKVLTSAMSQGSVELNWDLSGLLALAASGLRSKIGLHVKGYGSDKKSATASVGLLINDRTVIGADAFVDEKKAVVSCPELLGNSAYGVNMEMLMEMLMDEAPEDVDVTEIAELMSKLETMDVDALCDMVTKYRDLTLKALFESSKTERTEREIKIGDETVSAVVFSADITLEDVITAATKVYTAYRKDTASQKLIEDLLLSFDVEKEDIDDLYDEIEEALADAGELAADDDHVMAVSFAIHKKNRNLLQISFEMAGEENGKVEITLGVDPVSPKYAAVVVSGEDMTATVECRRTEDTADKLAMQISVKAQAEDQNIDITATLNHDRKNGNYQLELPIPGDLVEGLPFSGDVNVTVSGTYLCTANELSFSLDKAAASMSGALGLNVSLDIGLSVKVLAKDNTAPKAPKNYKDVMNEMVMAELAENLQTSLMELMEVLPEDIMTLLPWS